MKTKLFFLITFMCVTLFSATTYAAPELKAQSAVLIDAQTGAVIYSKQLHLQKYPASMTKLMTALLALEYADGDFTDIVQFSERAVTLPWDASKIGMKAGETLTLDECMYAMLLPSANEVSNAVAEHIGGSIENFAIMMTERAAELGCRQTNFTNPNGLHNENHYTTAYDMSLIMRECIKHPDFIRYISTQTHTIPPTEILGEPREIVNSNKMIIEGNDFYNEYIIGGKTGYTDQAGHTLATYAEKDGAKMISIVMFTAKNEIYTDTTALVDFGAQQYANVTVFDKNSFNGAVIVSTGAGTTADLNLAATDNITMFLPQTFEIEDVQCEMILPETIDAPINAGDIIGSLRLSYQGVFLKDVDLAAVNAVEIAPPPVIDTPLAAAITEILTEQQTEDEAPQKSYDSIIVWAIAAIVVLVLTSASLLKYFSDKRSRDMYIKDGLSKLYKYKNQ